MASTEKGNSPGRGALWGWTAGMILGWVKVLVLYAWNPLFFDSRAWSVLLFLLFPGLVCAILGLLLGALLRRGGPRRARPIAVIATAALLLTLGILNMASHHREMNPSKRLRILVTGVDGATWEIIDPMVARGELPNFKRLRGEGASGTCLSLLPMFSNRIFTSIATGKLPGNHGVVGINDTAENLKSARLWDILGTRGWVTGTMEWYVTWPPEARESGFTVPGLYSRSSATSPVSLRFIRELRMGAKAGRGVKAGEGLGYAIALIRHGLRLSTLVEGMELAAAGIGGELNHRERYYRQHYLWVRLKTDLFCRMVETYDLDFGGLVYKATDSLGHSYWKYFEPGPFSGVSEEQKARFGDVIPGAYRRVDEALERLSRRVEPGGWMGVISDHGFCAAAHAAEGISSIKTTSLLRFAGLDREGWEYVNIGGAACLMLRGTEDEEAHSRAMERVAGLFRGATVAGEEGPVFHVDPHDLPGTGDDYVAVGFRHEVVDRLTEGVEVEIVPGERVPLRDLVVTTDLSGDHELEGILILTGQGLRERGRLEGATVLDLTPTLLALAGIPLGEDMDGRILTEGIEEDHLAAHPVTLLESCRTPEYLPRLTSQPETELPAEVRARLRTLGYIE